MTQQLLQRYINDQCSESEKKQVAQWLCTCTETELENLLQQRWEEGFLEMPAEEANALWQKMKQQIAPATSAKAKLVAMDRFWKPLAAAAVLVVTGILVARLFFPNPQPDKINHTATTEIHEKVQVVQWAALENNTENEQDFYLEDSTRVLLYGNSRIRFTKPFAAEHRTIYLEGKGLFNVTKDVQRPFSVISNDVSTTALGTQFLVSNYEKDKKVLIKLFEGKVVVQHTSQQFNKKDAVYLVPGESLTSDSNGHFVKTLPPPARNKAVAVKDSEVTTAAGDELNFINATLADVFEKLEIKYKRSIRFNKQEINGKYFTGIIAAGDSLQVVLKLVAEMNGLKVEEYTGGYAISKFPE